ncbi:DNA repair protein RecO [Jeotgalibacillus haloalkalitolerans]|uniref:DNA repair protein RecO n=1 Tax=Jeotgalibacillus haloalkalitolerans TaxID=3104292 RepID=A0ABU5KM51_9BACL|nr:DNA repair protein RecO [Jeotgalibacillus sp. HH7-29]MDZ5712202.1 DNA repair protein RecO [Jeotgalibacillus sp. HH7-29]
MLHKCEGIVIRTRDYGETNKVVILFTRELGKVALMARGAKKTNSRLSSVSQMFTHGIYLYHGGSGMGSLQQGDMISSSRTMKEDLYKAAYASYMAELLDKAVEDRKPDPFLFELLQQSYALINEGYDEEVISYIFELKLLPLFGVQPVLNQCVNCGAGEGDFSFSFRMNGFLCHRCAHLDDYRLPLSSKAVRIIRLFYFIDLQRLGKVSLQESTKQELKKVIRTYYDEYVGVYARSRSFLDQMDRMKKTMEGPKDT